MKKGDPLTPKQKVAALERVITRVDGYEQRALADLRVAGYAFTDLDQARRYLKASRTLAAFSREALIDALASTHQ